MSERLQSIQECGDCVEPADAFGLVANETRISILEALWTAEGETVRFSELRETVGMRDSAQFNYHLDKLTDQFVRKVEAGYQLRHAGEKVVQAVLAGSFTEHPTIEPIDVDDPCVQCGAELQAVYDDEQLSIQCPDCGYGHGEYAFPPGGLTDRDDEEILAAFDQRVRHLHCLAKDGVCPECSGRMETTVERADACCVGSSLTATHRCSQCNHQLCSAVGLALLDDSEVVGFHREHGVSLSERPYWTLSWCVSDEAIELAGEEPQRFEVAIEQGGETLTVTLDDDLSVLETSRSA
ncbi:winged helix-turn-helix domain-containing protein [Halolamina salifodinae]|uniref:DNA-directed RNA polymerase subunit RPC12/RpoP n=1 Tax=Halolamina salifodinae TaxID=1202767 RepID=A0A8T4GZB9_9EURY|nr:helix-turn-helix domain-containing protein [Halolamina salifodinae]MBP1986894.1 DNA-directed RNA polymerase subunit RPC12/RpoP [Halolamina salifodinae]